jgi:hypothetical protein
MTKKRGRSLIDVPLPKDQSLKVSGKILRIGRIEKLSGFERAILIFFFETKFYLLHPHENQSKFLG